MVRTARGVEEQVPVEPANLRGGAAHASAHTTHPGGAAYLGIVSARTVQNLRSSRMSIASRSARERTYASHELHPLRSEWFANAETARCIVL